MGFFGEEILVVVHDGLVCREAVTSVDSVVLVGKFVHLVLIRIFSSGKQLLSLLLPLPIFKPNSDLTILLIFFGIEIHVIRICHDRIENPLPAILTDIQPEGNILVHVLVVLALDHVLEKILDLVALLP